VWRGLRKLTRLVNFVAAPWNDSEPYQVAIGLPCTVITCDKREALAQRSASSEAIQTACVTLDCFAYARNDA
jgi:hypothetical protein